jgi:cytoplasmic iron level regulating protein YaaA (DUF328/UPF0246 family)
MITLLSPAKTLNLESITIENTSIPRLLYDTNRLSTVLKKKSARSLAKLMNINDQLALLNAQRFKAYSEEFTSQNSKAALLAFAGDVYRGLEAETLSQADLDFSQDHVRILSGFYGLLRPLDLMQAYRLEMGTKLRTSRGKDLYKFWGKRITSLMNEDIENTNASAVINLASKEYYKSIQEKDLKAPIYQINFKEYRNEKLTFVSFNAKKARGLMTRFIIDNRITNPEELKHFNTEGYGFEPELSKENSFMFTR